jgi:undecaprenyl diphosphate synthase
MQTELQHIAIILDGNRRWAKENGKKTLDGHKRGAEVFRELSIYLFAKRHIPYVTAFVFSKENWERAEEEVSYLMRLVVKAVEMHLDEFHNNNIRIQILGSRDKLPKAVLDAIQRTELKTKNNDGGVLSLCFNYGGKQELVDACKKLLTERVSPDDVDEKMINTTLYGEEIPDVDLLVRTSGEQRTSGFMLWRAAYAELYFMNEYWPDITADHLDAAIDDYEKRQRRFGV